MADVKVSGLPLDSSLKGTDYVPLNDATGPVTKRTLLSTFAAWLFNQINIPDGSGSPRTRDSEMMFDFVQSGLVWSGDAYASTRNASMTSGICYINGRRLSINSVAARSFTASKDTYIDILDNGDGTATTVYTEVANNAASPALAANSMRIGIIVTGASNIAAAGSVNQGQKEKVLPIVSSQPYQVTDSLGNLICPRDPNRSILGYREILANVTTTSTSFANIVGLSVPVLVPNLRKIEVETAFRAVSGNSSPLGVYSDIADTSTEVADAVITTPGVSYQAGGGNAKGMLNPSSGLHTFNARNKVDANTGTWYASATSPAFLEVRLK